MTKITYPDGTATISTYDKLDLASYTDRESRKWTYTRDANRRLTAMTDPIGNQTLYGYNHAGKLTSLTDPKTNTTSWTYDVEGRVTSKQYADASTASYTYEATTSRLKFTTDALSQTKQYTYAQDDQVTGISYLNAVNTTPNVSFTYDAYFRRPVSMTDGTGTTHYDYVAPFVPGALQRQQECFTPTGGTSCSYQVVYAYDSLGRISSRTVSGAGAETFQYDAIGRLIDHASDLGEFALSYLGQTSQVAQRQLQASTLKTTWDYLNNTGDRRLAGINNTGLSAGEYSNFQFDSSPEKLITAITETSDGTLAYPSASSQTAAYNNVNQLTNLSGQTLSYDANGNLLSDGLRNYAWDAENRLVLVTYPAAPGKQSTFAYDGLSRRVLITDTPSGGAASSTRYVWCGSQICQTRNGSGSPIKSFYPEGEFVVGSPVEHRYYGTDQIGSVRRIFISGGSTSKFDYDPYGNTLQATGQQSGYTYAGMFYHEGSGLYLTQFRAYDSLTGRWLSRDSLGETSDCQFNLYGYVDKDPLRNTDPLGLALEVSDCGTAPDRPTNDADQLAEVIFGHGSRHFSDPMEDMAVQNAIREALPSSLPLGVQGRGSLFLNGNEYQFRYYGLGLDVNVGTHFPVGR